MKKMSSNARQFVDSVAKYVVKNQMSRSADLKVKNLLDKVSQEHVFDSVARVESPVALTADESQKIAHIVEKYIGHPVTVTVEIVPELIGGMKITVGDWIMDTSYLYQLTNLKSELLNV